ncbi:MAG TPA: hypothetical protein VET66_15445, partial [Steroidobacteraceae bacterium]|nr:hypothetical protein [Steroidobacteraceae bacterium]
ATNSERRLAAGAADRGEVLTAQLAAVTARRAALDALRTATSALEAVEGSVQRPVWPTSNLKLPTPLAAAADSGR